MSDKLIEGHEYDGIREFDNALPAWWLITFYATIIFGFLYWIHYQFGGGPTQAQELATNMARHDAARGSAPRRSESELLALFNAENAAKGHGIFAVRCASCHAENGGGLIGPNLTDFFWIVGEGRPSDLYKVVREGVPAKGMPAWGDMMSDDEVVHVSAFVHSLKGQNVKNGKAPQGNEFP